MFTELGDDVTNHLTHEYNTICKQELIVNLNLL